jgi:hypothetical protein
MNNPSDNDVLTCLFVRILEYYKIKSEEQITNLISEKEWMSIYNDNIGPINIRNFVLLYNYEKYIWVEVMVTEEFIESNNHRPIGAKLYIGKVQNVVYNKHYDFGSLVYFTIGQVVEHLTFEKLLERYKK